MVECDCLHGKSLAWLCSDATDVCFASVLGFAAGRTGGNRRGEKRDPIEFLFEQIVLCLCMCVCVCEVACCREARVCSVVFW